MYFLCLGASALSGMYRTTSDQESVDVVHKAIASGINYIDTAPWYGHGKAETILGKVTSGFNFTSGCNIFPISVYYRNAF